MIRRPPRSTLSSSSAASDVYKRQELNLANDHNQMIMDLMKKISRRHNFMILFHEKPFAGINGSGKHNNWSLSTDTGVNLFSPGKNPKSNLQFLTFVINTLKALYVNQDL